MARVLVQSGTGRWDNGKGPFFCSLSTLTDWSEKDTDGTGRLAIFTGPSVPSCFSETGRDSRAEGLLVLNDFLATLFSNISC